MKLGRILIILTSALLICGIAFMVFSIHSRMVKVEYEFQIDAVLSAAVVANNGEALTEPDKAVISEYNGKRAVVVPGNYTALSSYLRKDAAMPLLIHIDTEKALKLTVCGEAVIYAAPDDETGDVVLVQLETQGNVFRMRTDGGNQWPNLLACCTKGTYHDDNLPLD